MAETTAEVTRGLDFATGQRLWVFTIWTDREQRTNGGLTKGKKAGSIVEDDLPHLLHRVSLLIEQEGSLQAVAGVLREKLADS